MYRLHGFLDINNESYLSFIDKYQFCYCHAINGQLMYTNIYQEMHKCVMTKLGKYVRVVSLRRLNLKYTLFSQP